MEGVEVMKYYKNGKNEVYENPSAIAIERLKLTYITTEEADELRKPPEPTTEELAASIRAQRNALMADCDWVAIKATETGEPVPKEWEEYRQALRDITLQAGFPEAVIWPEVP